MNQLSILLPMGALATLTFAVLLLIPIRRVIAGRRGQIVSADFAYGESSRVPGEVSIPNRNYMNLLEIPVLFYVACLMYVLAGRVDAVALTLAWTYVALRCVHSAIHLTYNHVIHRLIAFAVSNVVLGLLWTWFFVRAWGSLV